jgi:hypothetical protein
LVFIAFPNLNYRMWNWVKSGCGRAKGIAKPYADNPDNLE